MPGMKIRPSASLAMTATSLTSITLLIVNFRCCGYHYYGGYMDYIKGLPLAPHRCRSAPHQLPLAMAIIGEEQTEQPPAVCNCTEKCKAGEVNTACPVCSVNMDSCTGKEAAPEEPTEQEQPQNGMGGLLIFLVVGLLGGGAALYYFKFMKPKQNVKGSTDLDEFDFDEYDEDEPEEETDIADTEQEDEEE